MGRPLKQNNVIPMTRRQEEVQRALLEDMEISCQSLRKKQEKLNRIGDVVIDRVEEAINDEKISPYRAALAFGRLVDSITRMESLRLSLWDRINGTVGLFGPLEEDLGDDEVDLVTERFAESLCLEVIKLGLEDQKKEAARLALEKAQEEAAERDNLRNAG